MKFLSSKLFRLSWVLVMLISAFLLGRFLQPKPAGMSRALRQAPPIDFSRMRFPGNRNPGPAPLRRNVNPYQK